MVVTSPLSSRLNRFVGPWLLRFGISVRSTVASISGKPAQSHYLLDHLLLMPFARKIISVEVHNLAEAAAEEETSLTWKEWAKSVMDRVRGRTSDEQLVKPKTTKPPKNERLEILEKYIRPVLVPNEMWEDVLRWRAMSHFKYWVRSEFLIAKYGADVGEALVAYPQLRLSPQIEPMKYHKRILLKLFGLLPDSITERKQALPSSPAVVKAFFMEKWNTQKDAGAQQSRLRELCTQLKGEMATHEGFSIAQIPPDTDLSALSLEDILELALGQVVGCGPFNALCEDAGILQLVTKEYISGLALYLRKRAERYQGKTIVLDVGSGDGEVLANALREALTLKRPRFAANTNSADSNSDLNTLTVVATDNGSWGISITSSVEKLSARDALAKYCGVAGQQVIVLCSWMPPGEDWTAFFRQCQVDEYILIGEYDDGICGDNWATWGNPEFCSQTGDDPTQSSLRIPYAEDEYKRQELDKLVPFQFSRLDTAFSRSSSTISFRRLAKSK